MCRIIARTILMFAICFLSLLTELVVGQESVDFGKQIFPLLQQNCLACHHLKEPEGGLNLESFEAMMKGGSSGNTVVAGKSGESEILKRVLATDDTAMPPADNSVGAKKLTEAEIQWLRAWIDQGAARGTSPMVGSIQWSKVPPNLNPIYAVASSTDGQFVAAGRANRVYVYRWPSIYGAAQATMLEDPSVQSTLGPDSPTGTHLDMVQSIAISPDGSRIATGGYQEAKIWRREIRPQPASIPGIQAAGGIMASSIDGRHLAVATSDFSLKIWNAETKQHRATLLGHTAAITGIAWSPSMDRLVSSDLSGRAILWSLALDGQGEVRAEQSLATYGIGATLRSLTMIDASKFAGVLDDGRIQVWEVATPPADPNVATPVPSTGPQLMRSIAILGDVGQVKSVAAIPGEPARIAIASADGAIRVAQVPSGNVVATMQHGGPLRLLSVNADYSRAASYGEDGSLKIWNLADGQMVSESRGDHRSQFAKLSTEREVARQQALVDRLAAKVPELEKARDSEVEAKNKQQMARDKAAEGLTAKVNERDAAKKVVAEAEAQLAAAKQAVEEAMKKVEQVTADVNAKKEMETKAEAARVAAENALKTEDQKLASSGEAVQRAMDAIPVQQAEVEREKQVLTASQTKLAEATQKASISSPPTAAVFTGDSKTLISLHEDNTVRSVRVDKAKQEAIIEIPEIAKSILVPTYGGIWIIARETGLTQVWPDHPIWLLERTLGVPGDGLLSDRVTSMDFSPDGTQLVVGSGPPSRFGDIKLFAVDSGQLVRDFGQAHSDTVLTIKFSPDGRTIASGGADKIIRLHDVASGAFQRTLEGHTHHVLGLAWKDDGHWIASGSADNTIKVWDVSSGQQLRTIGGFGKEVTAVGFIGTGNQLVSASADRQARLHDASNGNGVRSFGGPADALYTATIAEDGLTILAGGQEGKLFIWQTDNAQVLQQLQ